MPPPRIDGKRGYPNILKSKEFTLAEVFSPYTNCQQKNAFTLAEVLITLAIIGVVAALTLPVILKGKERKELEAGFKKQYSVLQQAFTKLNTDKGEIYVRDLSGGTRLFKKDFVDYFNIVKDCKFEDCMKKNGTNIYKDFLNKTSFYTMYIDDGQFITQDGALFMLNDATSQPLLASFDTNGPNKGPNRIGFDVFVFQLMENGKLLPMGADGTWFTEEKYCSTAKTDMRNGLTCAYKAISDPNYFRNLP